MVRLIIQISKGLVRDPRTRRSVMFYTTLAALLMLFVGAVFLDAWLRERIFLFLLWWAACAWVTLLAVLLAVFDMLLLRAGVRREKRRLEQEYLRTHPPPADDETAR